MTDKQIIIDGVDVSGCAYFGSTMFPTKNCTMDSEYLHSCESCYCYYKQLKRAEHRIVELNKTIQAKEQECEELKKDRERWKSNFNGKVSAIEELLQQLDQLKAELEQEKDWHKTSDEISKANSEYTAKLKQTLTEIKEIAEDESYIGFWDEQITKILQKISEVEK